MDATPFPHFTISTGLFQRGRSRPVLPPDRATSGWDHPENRETDRVVAADASRVWGVCLSRSAGVAGADPARLQGSLDRRKEAIWHGRA
jgi:hypothetical protein